jgi:glutaredoxin 3
LSRVQVYTTTYCSFCYAAKALLDRKGIKYEEIDVTKDPVMKRKVMDEIGWRTVPIILIDGKLIGGFQDLRAMDIEKKLDEMLR